MTETKSTIHSDPKKMRFTVTAKCTEPVSFKVASLNFNNAAFQRDAGYDDKDFERRVMVLKNLVESWGKSGVSVIHLQEISGRFMKLETLRHHLMSVLPDSWTTTGPIGRHGDPTMCLSLMTLWDARVLHLDALTNFHFSEDEEGKAGDKLVPDIQATSNALITAFSLVVPETTSSHGGSTPLHTGGLSIDPSVGIVTVNCHLPLKGPLKVKCVDRLFAFLDKKYPANKYGRIVTGDMNLFEDERESSKEILRRFANFGHSGCEWTPTGIVYDTPSGGKRQTTFIGMKHDLKNLMKKMDPDAAPDKFEVWCKGNAQEIAKCFGSAPWPLDWFLVSAGGPLLLLNTDVMEVADLAGLDTKAYKKWLASFESQGKVPDFGNYLSDHLPLVGTVLVKAD